MAAHFHKLSISRINRETPDCVSIIFDVPENLKETFRYREGQNLTLRSIINGEDVRRSYSICAAPHEQQLKVAVKKVDNGLFSTFANEALREGDTVEVMAPTGGFNAHLATSDHPSYLAIAAGSGITPVISIIKHCLKTQPGCDFTLLFGNKNRGSIIFFDELQALKDKYLGRLNLINILSRERMDTDIHFGRIDREKLAALSDLLPYQTFNAVYLCGPEQMIFEARQFLEEKGLKKDSIHFELFTAPGQATAKSTSVTVTTETEKGPVSKIEITLDGRTFQMELPYHGKSILDAALQHGADLPFACKGGVCSTCRARVTEGEVAMDVNYALEADEVEKGFILTCQAHPRSSHVKIDFDSK